jgi:hypothetical protein
MGKFDPFRSIMPPESGHPRNHFDNEHPRLLGLQTLWL